MILSSFASVGAMSLSEVKDMPDNWSTAALKHTVSNGILQGKGEGYIRPEDYLTRAEMATIINRAFNSKIGADISSYTDVSASDWYYSEFSKALNMQTFYGVGDNRFNPSANITREEVFIAIARALVVSTDDYSALDKFTDGGDVSSWAKEYVAALVKDGYVNGYGNGLILPKNNITRAEFAQLLYNIFKQYVANEGIHNDLVKNGGVVIQNPGISLENVTVNGDLVIGDGVGDGILTLTNVTVNGRLLVRGAKQITVKDCVFTKGVVVKNVNGVVHFDNYRHEEEFNIFTAVTEATFKKDSYSIDFGGSSTGSDGKRYHNIVLDTNGGSLPAGATSVISKASGSLLNVDSLPTPSKTDYVFGGWYKDEALTEPFVSEHIISGMKLYAKWRVKVTFNSNGGTPVDSVITDIGGTVAQPTDPTLSGKVFGGWFLDSACTTEFNFATPVTTNITLYAKWTDTPVITYIVTYDSKGGSLVSSDTVNAGSYITPPADPTKEGHDFLGWYKDDACTVAFDFATEIITSDTTLYAKWNIKKFTVTFVTGPDASTVAPIYNVEYNSYVSAPLVDPTREGYDFAGWYKGENGTGGVFDFATDKITADTSIYAYWTPKFYKLHFNTVGGKINGVENPFIDVNHGVAPMTPDDPVKDNAVFGGWYRDAAYTTPFNFGTDTITEETTLYAKWTYTVTFNTNGGSDVADIPAVHNTTITQPADPVKAGENFTGWFTDPACTIQFNFATPITGSITLYAGWSPIPVTYYTVTFDSNGGSAIVPSTIQVVSGAKVTKPLDPTKTGYTFNGWLKPDNTAFDFDTETITADIILKADWVVDVYTVTFDSDGGSAVSDQDVSYGNKATRPSDPTKTGYTFLGWFKADDTEFNFDAEVITSDITLKAKWEINTYTVTFDANGGSPVPSPQNITYGNKATKPADPTKVGSTFLGWFKADDTEFDFNTENITESITLKAKWEANKYTVTFETGAGASTVSPINNVEYGSTITEPAEPTKTGYTFGGWYKNASCTISFDFGTDVITEDTTLYAKWTINEYTVSFDTDGGSLVDDQTVKYLEKASKPATNPTKAGHTFLGWFKADLTTVFDFDTQITTDTTIYAKWEINTYLVEFESNGGTTVAPQYVDYEGYVTEPAEPTRSGYTFAGWYKEDTFVTEFDFANDIITEDTTLYAKWDLIPIEYVTITFVTNCANTLDDKEIVKGSKISQPSVENPGYTLEGWYTSEDFKPETKIDFETYTFNVSITIYANWTENPVYYTVKFYDGMSDEYLEGEETYISGSLIPETDIPDATKYNYEGFYKDSTISALYTGNEYQHYIDPLWFYLGDDGKWKLFDMTTDTVDRDLELHYGAKWLEMAAYVNKVSHEFQIKTPYEVDIEDAYLTNVFKDMLFRNRNNLNNAYDLPQLDETKEKLMNKLISSGIIDENKNILIQNIKLKFARLIGESELRDFIVENAKKQLSSNDGLKDTLTEYIDSHSASDIEKLIIKAIDKQLKNPATRQETIEMIEELVLDVIDHNSIMFADMIEEYIETEIDEGRADEVKTLVGKIISEGMSVSDLKAIALKVDMTPYINEYIDSLSIDQLKSYYDRIINKFIDSPNFKTYIDEYLDEVDDETLTAFMKNYINQTGEGTVFKDYLTDMADTTLADYIADNLKDVMDDADIYAYIKNYIETLSEADFREYTELYIKGLDSATKEAYIKSYLDTLSADELAAKVADYVLGLSDVSGELNTYIGKISDSDLADYISEYIKENQTNADIIGYIIDYVKEEIASATPNATVMNKVTEFVTNNASSIDEVKNVMKDVLPEYAKTISAATLTARITEYFDTTEGNADFITVLKKYLVSLGYTTTQIDGVLSNDASIASFKNDAIAYVVDEIRKDNSEVFAKDPVTGEFTNTWVNVDKVASSFISNSDFIAEMLTVDGVMDEILDNGDALNVITSKDSFKTQIMAMIVDDSNDAVLDSAVQDVIGDSTKKANVVNKVITSLLAGDDNADKAEVKKLVSKMIAKQGKDESVADLAGYLKDNLSTNQYAMDGAVNYIYNNRMTEIDNIVNHIKNPSIDTTTLIEDISSSIVEDDAERAEIINLIVTFITKPENASKKDEIIDDAIEKLVSDSTELSNYIGTIFADETKKSKFVASIKNVIFEDTTTAKADIKEFVNVIISSSNTFGKETLINTYIDDIWAVETDREEFIDKLAEEFVTNATVRSNVMDDAIDAIVNTPTLKNELIEKLIIFLEEADTHMESVVEKIVEKMIGTATEPGDATLKEDMIDFIVEYLKAHPDDLDDIVDEVLEDDPDVDGELGDILNEFVRQLIEEDKFTINEDNKFIAEGMLIKLSEMTEYTDLFEMVPADVEKLYKKIQKFLPRDIIQDIYSRTINAYLTQLEAGINSVTNTTDGEAETFVTLTINPVIDLLNPLYDRAMDKAMMRLENHFFYNENDYLKEIVDILTPEAILDGNDSLATDVLSGYKFKEFDDYYFLLMRLSVLTDDTAQWYMDNIGQEKTEQMMDGVQSRVMRVVSYYNKALAILDEYTNSGDLPDKLDNKYVNKLINILDSKFPYFDKLLNKFDDSKLDRPITEADYDKLYKVVELLFRNRTYTADDLFDSKYADKLDRFRVDEDTYKAENDKVGVARMERDYE